MCGTRSRTPRRREMAVCWCGARDKPPISGPRTSDGRLELRIRPRRDGTARCFAREQGPTLDFGNVPARTFCATPMPETRAWSQPSTRQSASPAAASARNWHRARVSRRPASFDARKNVEDATGSPASRLLDSRTTRGCQRRPAQTVASDAREASRVSAVRPAVLARRRAQAGGGDCLNR